MLDRVSKLLFAVLLALPSAAGAAGVTACSQSVAGTATLTGIALPRILKLKTSTVAGNGDNGIRISGNEAPPKARLRDCSIDGNAGDGLEVSGHPSRVTISSCSFDRNTANGVTGAKKLRAKDSSFNENGEVGIESASGSQCRVTLINCGVTGNARFGVHAGPDETACAKAGVRLKGSTLTGNATDSGCFVTKSCADLASDVPPRLDVATTCERSYLIASGLPGTNWSVCSLD